MEQAFGQTIRPRGLLAENVRLICRRRNDPGRQRTGDQRVAQDGLQRLVVGGNPGHPEQVGQGGRSDPAFAPRAIKHREIFRMARPKDLGKALRQFVHQGIERDCPGLELASGRKQHGVERRVLPANQIGQPFVSLADVGGILMYMTAFILGSARRGVCLWPSDWFRKQQGHRRPIGNVESIEATGPRCAVARNRLPRQAARTVLRKFSTSFLRSPLSFDSERADASTCSEAAPVALAPD